MHLARVALGLTLLLRAGATLACSCRDSYFDVAKSVDEALKVSQTAADREMKKAGYYK